MFDEPVNIYRFAPVLVFKGSRNIPDIATEATYSACGSTFIPGLWYFVYAYRMATGLRRIPAPALDGGFSADRTCYPPSGLEVRDRRRFTIDPAEEQLPVGRRTEAKSYSGLIVRVLMTFI
jgi:hypothetical protein